MTGDEAVSGADAVAPPLNADPAPTVSQGDGKAKAAKPLKPTGAGPVKTRMSVLDIRTQAHSLRRRLTGGRVVNIYDVNARTYLFKLNVPPRYDSAGVVVPSSGDKEGAGETEPPPPTDSESGGAAATASPGVADELDVAEEESATVSPPMAATAAVAAPEVATTEGGWVKTTLLVESGARLHTTRYRRETASLPSAFTLKLRKHLRTLRLSDVSVLGDGDRVVELVFFAAGVPAARLILELYSAGNVILTDGSRTILALLRPYTVNPPAVPGAPGPPPEPVIVGPHHPYPVAHARDAPPVTLDVITSALAAPPAATSAADAVEAAAAPDPAVAAAAAAAEEAARAKLSDRARRAADRKRRRAAALAAGAGDADDAPFGARKALARRLCMGPQLAEHALAAAGLPPDASVRAARESLPSTGDALLAGVRQVEQLLAGEEVAGLPLRGYLFGGGRDGSAYTDFSPYLLAQYTQRAAAAAASAAAGGSDVTPPMTVYERFDDAVDVYFADVEQRRQVEAAGKKEAALRKKVDKLTGELRGRVSALDAAAMSAEKRARALDAAADDADEAMGVVRLALAGGVDWKDLGGMVVQEKAAGNPVAQIIHSLKLDRNEIVLMLPDVDDEGEEAEEGADGSDEDEDDDDDDDEPSDEDDDNDGRGHWGNRSKQTRKLLLVSVDLARSARANAAAHFSARKVASVKRVTASAAAERTLAAATAKANAEATAAAAAATAAAVRASRLPAWYEKFNWFLSSDGLLVLAARDAAQEELLLRTYLGPADAYVSADVDKTLAVVVKNTRPAVVAAAYAACAEAAASQAAAATAGRGGPGGAAAAAAAASSAAAVAVPGLEDDDDDDEADLDGDGTRAFERERAAAAVESPDGGDGDGGMYPPLPPTTLAAAGTFALARSSAWGLTAGVPAAWWVPASQVSWVPTPGSVGGKGGGTSAGGRIVVSGEKQWLPPAPLIMGLGFMFCVGDGDAAAHRGERAVRGGGGATALGASLSIPSEMSFGVDEDGEEMDDDHDDGDDQPAAGAGSGDDAVADTVADEAPEDASTNNVGGDGEDEAGNPLTAVATTGAPPVATAPASGSADAPHAEHDGGRRSRGKAAKEKRAKKKAAAAGGAGGEKASGGDGGGGGGSSSGAAGAKAAAPAVIPRGKRTKLRRMRQKYGDQNETERALALAVLGSSEVAGFAPAAPDPNETVTAAAAAAAAAPSATAAADGDGAGRGGGGSAASASPEDAAAAAERAALAARIRERRAAKAAAREAAPPQRATASGRAALRALEAATARSVVRLTATPARGDTLAHAVAVVAPYPTLAAWPYKVKLLPGSLKRGRAYKAAVGYCLRTAERDRPPRRAEREAMRATPEAEAVLALLPGTRVSAPGLNATGGRGAVDKGAKGGGGGGGGVKTAKGSGGGGGKGGAAKQGKRK
ncbi:hypothetical protein MMPV_006499 [Pyropia vietnamensis]